MTRVLVVDDYEPWRRYVRAMLQSTDRWTVVGEAADGPEAIQMAADLKPDLILLDIGLPTLNGFKVARRIISSSDNQRILFVTGHRSFADEALAAGAAGYIVKSDAGRDLLPAMDAVASGCRYIGTNVGCRTANAVGAHDARPPRPSPDVAG
jgi:DNA-binding NarL/FixJ family response regulator